MVVNHNIPALSTYNVINSTSNALQKSINKLSTGLRINSASDDAAGLAISEKMRAQVRGLDQAVANSQDGISMIQTAEGALSETHSILQRMRELSVQAANDTLTQQDRGYIQEEVDQLREEITRIGNTTQFNKKKLLNGDAAALWSSSDSETQAIIKGGLRSLDQFGQKSSVEGNYNIKIKADAGQGEVQKSDIFTIKHADSISNEYINKEAGVTKVAVSNMPAATYTVSTGSAGKVTGAVKLTGVFGVDTNYTENKATLSVSTSSAAQTITLTINGKTHTANIAANASTASIVNQLKSEFGSVVNVKDSGASVTLTSRDYSFKTTTQVGTAAVTRGSSTASEVSRAFSSSAMVTASSSGAEKNASILFEVTAVDTDKGTVTLKASVKTLDVDGTVGSTSVSDIRLDGGSSGVSLGVKLGLSSSNSAAFKLVLGAASSAQSFSVGDKFTYNVSANSSAAGAADSAAVKATVEGITNSEWPDGWGTNSVTRDTLDYTINTSKVEGKDLHFQHYYLNEDTGEVMEGDITLATDEDTFNAKNSTNQT
ncbi:MAG: flagellin, partial [Fretibacterium sp.]|nr:flagellin [Fretibacterium sp.]